MRRASDPLLAGLVDDAALFPPGNAPMDVALAEHARYRAAPWSAAVGPFLCPASRIDELVAYLPVDQHIDLALVNDVTDDAALHAREVALKLSGLRWIETRHDRLGDDPAAVSGGSERMAGAPFAYLEVPRTGFESTLDLIGERKSFQAAKYRTGGVTAEAFPSEEELATFLLACASRGLAFKATAGLHHAVRHTTDEGFEAHGVLNVLVATRVALAGVSLPDVVAVLAERRAEPLVGFVQAWDDETAADVRQAFRSFGCCGVTDPLADLREFGLLEKG
jgi:hypothetical protein